MRKAFSVAATAALTSALSLVTVADDQVPRTLGAVASEYQSISAVVDDPLRSLPSPHAHQKEFRFEYSSSDQDDIEVDVSISSGDTDDKPEVSVSVISGPDNGATTAIGSLSSAIASNTTFAILPTAIDREQSDEGSQKAYAKVEYPRYSGYGIEGSQGSYYNPYEYNGPNGYLTRPSKMYHTASASVRVSLRSTISAADPTQTSIAPSYTNNQPVATQNNTDYYRRFNEGWLPAQRSDGFFDGFGEGETRGYSSGFTTRVQAAQTGAKGTSLKEAHIEGENRGYHQGHFDDEQHVPFEYTQTHVPDIEPTIVETSSLPFSTTSLPRNTFPIPLESEPNSLSSGANPSQRTASESTMVGSQATPEISSSRLSTLSLATSSRPETAVYTNRLNPGGISNYGYGYGYGYGYPPSGYSEPTRNEDTGNIVPSVNAKFSDANVQLSRRGVIRDMLKGISKSSSPSANYGSPPPPAQIAQAAPVIQYSAAQPRAQQAQIQAIQPYQQSVQLQAIQPKVNDVLSNSFNAPQFYYAQPAYGYYGYGYPGEQLADGAQDLISEAVQYVTSLLNPETWCSGIFSDSSPAPYQPYYYQPQPYYTPAYQQPTYQQPLVYQQPSYQQSSYLQSQLIASYAPLQAQCYYLTPTTSCNEGIPYPETSSEYPAPQPAAQGEPSLGSSPSYATPPYGSQGSTPLAAPSYASVPYVGSSSYNTSPASTAPASGGDSSINSGDPSNKLISQYPTDQDSQGPRDGQFQTTSHTEDDLGNAISMLLAGHQTKGSAAQHYQGAALAPIQNVQTSQVAGGTERVNVLRPLQQNEAVQNSDQRPSKVRLNVGGNARLNVFPPYATRSSHN